MATWHAKEMAANALCRRTWQAWQCAAFLSAFRWCSMTDDRRGMCRPQVRHPSCLVVGLSFLYLMAVAWQRKMGRSQPEAGLTTRPAAGGLGQPPPSRTQGMHMTCHRSRRRMLVKKTWRCTGNYKRTSILRDVRKPSISELSRCSTAQHSTAAGAARIRRCANVANCLPLFWRRKQGRV